MKFTTNNRRGDNDEYDRKSNLLDCNCSIGCCALWLKRKNKPVGTTGGTSINSGGGMR